MIIEGDDPLLEIVLAKFANVNRILYGPDSVDGDTSGTSGEEDVDWVSEQTRGNGRLSGVSGFMESGGGDSGSSAFGFME